MIAEAHHEATPLPDGFVPGFGLLDRPPGFTLTRTLVTGVLRRQQHMVIPYDEKRGVDDACRNKRYDQITVI